MLMLITAEETFKFIFLYFYTKINLICYQHLDQLLPFPNEDTPKNGNHTSHFKSLNFESIFTYMISSQGAP